MFYRQFCFVKKNDHKLFLLRLGNNLKALRLSANFTQEQIANEIGVEISQISRIERGLIGTSVATFFDISKALNIPLKDFFDFNIDE
jgi:transcriptional regulator with XRE-family HTH domain